MAGPPKKITFFCGFPRSLSWNATYIPGVHWPLSSSIVVWPEYAPAPLCPRHPGSGSKEASGSDVLGFFVPCFMVCRQVV